jgi:hypothetical protein
MFVVARPKICRETSRSAPQLFNNCLKNHTFLAAKRPPAPAPIKDMGAPGHGIASPALPACRGRINA